MNEFSTYYEGHKEGYEDGYQAGWEDAKAEIIRCMHLVELSDYQKRG